MSASSRIEKLTKMLEADPADTFCLYALAQEFTRAGDHEKAIDFYDRTIGVDPDYTYAYFHKARSLESVGRHEDVRPTLELGLTHATKTGDAKAVSEIEEYLASL